MVASWVLRGVSFATIFETEFQRLKPKFKNDIPEYAQLSDILRLTILYLYGGTYIDCDFIIKEDKSLPLDFEQKESGLIIPLNNAIISTYQKNSELEKVIMNITNPFNLYTNFNIDTKNEIKHNLYKSYINAKKLLQNNNLKYREIDNLNDIEITNSKEFRDFTSYKINKYNLSKSQLAYIKNNFSFNIKNDNEYYIFQNPNSSIYNKDEHYLMNNNTKKTLEINDFTNYLSSNNTFHSCILDKDSLKNTYKEIANFYKDSIIKDNKIYIKSPKNYNSKFDFVELGEYIESMKKVIYMIIILIKTITHYQKQDPLLQ